MELTLSIAFNKEQTHLALVNKGSKGLQLEDIATIDSTLDICTPGFDSSPGFEELQKQIALMVQKSHRASITLPSDAMLIQHIPYVPDSSAEETSGMLNLEVMQNQPEKSVEDYNVLTYAMSEKKGQSSITLAVMSERLVEETVKDIMSGYELTKIEFVSRQLSAHAAFTYNYPDLDSKTTVLIGMYPQEIEFSVLINSAMNYYNVRPVAPGELVDEICDAEIEHILSTRTDFVDCIFLFGDSLTPLELKSVSERLSGLTRSVERLNAFRMCTTTLDARHKAYCQRTAHKFVPCVGSVLPLLHAPLTMKTRHESHSA